MLIAKNSKIKGQISIEYLMIIGVSLLIVGLLTGYAFMMYNETISSNSLKTSLLDMKKGINTVYALGEGNALVIEVSFPKDVTEIRLDGKAIYVTFDSFGELITDIIETDANISGTVPIRQGTHSILITNTNGAVTLNEI